MLESEGYPDTKGSLQRVSDYSKVPPSTLHRWFHGKNNPAPSDVVNEKRRDLSSMIEGEIYEIFKVLPAKRDEATYRELTTSVGILVDKMRLLQGLPTEIIQILPGFMDSLNKAGYDATEFFRKAQERLNMNANND